MLSVEMLRVVMLSVVKLSVISLSIIILNVIIQCVAMLSVTVQNFEVMTEKAETGTIIVAFFECLDKTIKGFCSPWPIRENKLECLSLARIHSRV